MELTEIKVPHPDYYYTHAKGYKGRPVVVFQRNIYNAPTEEQERQWELDNAVVTAHSGVMRKQKHELAGLTEPFSSCDVAECIWATRKAFPTYRVTEWWNGIGSHSLSISIMPKA